MLQTWLKSAIESVAVWLLFGSTAAAQLVSGTVVIMNFSQSKLVVAADSRAMGKDGQADDSQCKIGSFKHTTVFATGATAVRISSSNRDPIGGWRNLDLARKVASAEAPSYVSAKSMATSWAGLVANYWRKYYLVFPDSVVRLAEANNGILTYGFFAKAHAETIDHALVAVVFKSPGRNLDPISVSDSSLTDCWACGQNDSHLCALGRTEVARNFCSKLDTQQSHNGNGHVKQLNGFESQESLAIEVVELTSRLDPSRLVGGETDAVEITSGGKITWLLNNKHCEEE